MKITALVENTSVPGLPVEHGLSLYIETTRHTILFDSGQGTLFAENAERLGKDLAKVDLMVLSHGHYDHGGGLKTFLELNDHAPLRLRVPLERDGEVYRSGHYARTERPLRVHGRHARPRRRTDALRPRRSGAGGGP